jgi:hypothetical protein
VSTGAGDGGGGGGGGGGSDDTKGESGDGERCGGPGGWPVRTAMLSFLFKHRSLVLLAAHWLCALDRRSNSTGSMPT